MVVLLFAYALSVSILVPAWFLLAGPVRERRALVGLTYAALFVLAWCAALVLGFLSPIALTAGAAAMATLGAAAAWYSHRDERLLARFEARLDDPRAREAALDELRARIREIGSEGERVIALMEVASFPIRRLLDRDLRDEAQALVTMIDEELGPRLGKLDMAELRLLAARCHLHAGSAQEALAELERSRALGGAADELDALEAFVRAVRGESAQAESLVERAASSPSASVRELASLARAHVAAARGCEADAIAALRALRAEARAGVLALARAIPGPATELFAHLDPGASPYR